MAKIRTEIVIESNESLKIRRRRHSIRAWCEECERISIMAVPSEAAFLACQDVNSIVELMYSDKFHIKQIENMGLYICLTSLCLFPFDPDDAKSKSAVIKTIEDTRTYKQSFIN